MYNFQYANPTRICFGEGQIARLPELIPAGSRLLVLYGGGSIKQNGVYEQLTQALAGREWLGFPASAPAPVRSADGGGGSGQARAHRLPAGGGWWFRGGWHQVRGRRCLLRGGRSLGDPAGQGPHQGGAAAMLCADPAGHRFGEQPRRRGEPGEAKLSFYNPLVQPVFAVLDPATTYSLPPRQVGNGVVDAFVHILEQYLTFPVGERYRTGWRKGCCRCWWTTARGRWRSPPTTRCVPT